MIKRKNIQFIKLCFEAANIFSTCGKNKYAAILVDSDGHVVGMGYNGGPKNHIHCEDGGCPRYTTGSQPGSIYDNCIAVHAEQNAFLHSDYSSKAASIYVNGPPCFTCAKLIVNSTVKNLFYIKDDSYSDWNNVKLFLEKNNIEIREIDQWQLES